MTLSTQQRQDLAKGRPVPVVVDKTECVVVRKEVFERFADEFDPRTFYPHMAQMMAEDWDDPAMAVYDREDYDPSQRP